MRAFSFIMVCLLLLGMFTGCTAQQEQVDIAATTLPVYQFTAMLCEGTGLSVTRLVTENVSCLHDYSLNVRQVQAIESASLVVISGAGLEDFMADILEEKPILDASGKIKLLESCHQHEEGADHHHDADPHIWLSPANAFAMAANIYQGLCDQYPQHVRIFTANYIALSNKFITLSAYAHAQLKDLPCRELLTFHDGFAYLAKDLNLTILQAVEEESGAEASARELITLIKLTKAHDLPAIFTEKNGSGSAAKIIAAETGAAVFTLDMAMAGDDYFAAMYHNIDTIREALS